METEKVKGNSGKQHNVERTEEIQFIIERMPTKSSKWITLLVLFIITAIGVFGWVVKYHDVVTGSITINKQHSPVKLFANTSGKIKILAKNRHFAKDDEFVGYILNATNFDDLRKLKKIIDSIDLDNHKSMFITRTYLLNQKFNLGELNIKYYQFLNALNNYFNKNYEDAYIKQKKTLTQLLFEYRKMYETLENRIKYNHKNTIIFGDFHERDSILLDKKVISKAEFEKSKLNYHDAMSAKESSLYQLSELLQAIENTESKLELLKIEEGAKRTQLTIDLFSSFSDLKDSADIWEEKYVFKAPIAGKVQYLKFIDNNHYVQVGEPVVNIIPNDDKLYGQVSLPNAGAGKVKVGHEVIIKLDDFPHMEFGSIRGTVKTISLSTNVQQTQTGESNNYLVNVELPTALVTNYNQKLSNTNEIKGTAEIITNNRRLGQRIFDNLKYLVKTE